MTTDKLPDGVRKVVDNMWYVLDDDGGGRGSTNRIITKDQLDDLIASCLAANNGGWRKMSESKPDKVGEYLIQDKDGWRGLKMWEGLRFAAIRPVIAWQPLPVPYTEHKEDV